MVLKRSGKQKRLLANAVQIFLSLLILVLSDSLVNPVAAKRRGGKGTGAELFFCDGFKFPGTGSEHKGLAIVSGGDRLAFRT